MTGSAAHVARTASSEIDVLAVMEGEVARSSVKPPLLPLMELMDPFLERARDENEMDDRCERVGGAMVLAVVKVDALDWRRWRSPPCRLCVRWTTLGSNQLLRRSAPGKSDAGGARRSRCSPSSSSVGNEAQDADVRALRLSPNVRERCKGGAVDGRTGATLWLRRWPLPESGRLGRAGGASGPAPHVVWPRRGEVGSEGGRCSRLASRGESV